MLDKISMTNVVPKFPRRSFYPPSVVGANALMSLEIVGPERLSVSRSVTVAAKGIQKLESSPVVGGKLEGCLGASISALLARVVGDCGDGGATG